MKQTSIHSQSAHSTTNLASLIEDKASPLATRITVPVAIAAGTAAPQQVEEFNNTLKALNISGANKTKQHDLHFGAPQIDLALISGTLKKSAVHQIYPKHWRDQQTALSAGIALLKRQETNNLPSAATPVICFLTEEQSYLLDEHLTRRAAEPHLNSQDLIIITARNSDDLFWALEETMHQIAGAQMIAHFNMIPATRVQRLDYLAANTGNTCLLVSNHKAEAQSEATSSWSIQKIERQQADGQKTGGKTNLSFNLEYLQSRHESGSNQPSNSVWQLTWQSDENRFRAAQLKQKGPTEPMPLAA